MHDLRMIREQIDVLRDGMRRRGKLDTLAPFIDAAAAADADRRATIQAVEERKAARNAITQEVAKKKRAGSGSSARTRAGTRCSRANFPTPAGPATTPPIW